MVGKINIDRRTVVMAAVGTVMAAAVARHFGGAPGAMPLAVGPN